MGLKKNRPFFFYFEKFVVDIVEYLPKITSNLFFLSNIDQKSSDIG